MRIGADPFLESISRIQPTQSRIDATINDNENSSTSGELFRLIFAATTKASEEASAVSREKRAQLLVGELDDLPSLMVASEKSGILFELNLNVRNKVLDAYNEIMRLQV
jgi:flagellar hook-basal body complex protein FliE